jgi:hypothetical protein
VLKKLASLLSLAPLLWMLASESVYALEIGWAKVDITPPFTTSLAGYANRFGKKSTGLHDPLFARAVIISGNGEKIAVVSADLLLIHRELRDEVSRRVSALRLSSVLLYATHTHSGVGGYWDNFVAETLGMGWYEQRIFDFLVERLVTAIRQANDKMIPAKMGSSSQVFHDLSLNRRRRGEAIASEVAVIRFDNLRGKPEVAIVNFAAHPTILGRDNRLVSADYPGVISKTLEKHISIALFANGAAADLSPRRIRSSDRYEGVDAYGTKVATLAARLLDSTPTSEQTTVKSRTLDIGLPQATLAGALGDSLAFFVNPMFRRFVPTTTRLQGIALNKDVLTAWPGEVSADFQQALNKDTRQTTNGGKRWIISQANDHIGYIQTEHEYARGGYETSLSLYGPKLGAQLLNRMIEVIQELNGE